MQIGLLVAVCAISSFFLAMIIAPIVIRGMKKLHAEQSILGYVDNHASKDGTPTMGGVIFLLPTLVVSLIFGGVQSKVMLVTLATMLGYGILGFLDDFIKVKMHHNEGLKAYQKAIGQLGIAVIVTLYAYFSPEIGTSINLPFSDKSIDLSYFYIVFTLFVFLATTNAVNLTDGLDGLATSTTLIYVATFILITLLSRKGVEGDVVKMRDNTSMLAYLASIFGALLAFLWHNSNRASIFMGDTGSLALGGMVASVAIFSQNTFLVPIIGIMYVLSCISVIVQVIYFKVTGGKRVFLMAPLHHHLEYKGMSEAKIVAIYSIVTILCGIVALVSKLWAV